MDDRFNFEGASGRRANPLVRGLQRRIWRLGGTLDACLGQRPPEAFGILVYHRVARRSPDLPEPPYNVTPDQLRAQLAGLLARGYEAWPLRRVLRHYRSRLPISRRAFVVTFDDGYANNYSQAWPVLRDLGVPATIFVATAYLGSAKPFPFDRWEGVGQASQRECWLPLTVEQCTELHEGGLIELGTHTHTHQDFRGRPVEFQKDLEQSLAVLHSRFGLQEISFAFPQGRKAPGFAGADLVQAARQAGAGCALTTESELVLPECDPFDWGRFTVEGNDTAATLAGRLNGWYQLVRDQYRRLRAGRRKPPPTR